MGWISCILIVKESPCRHEPAGGWLHFAIANRQFLTLHVFLPCDYVVLDKFLRSLAIVASSCGGVCFGSWTHFKTMDLLAHLYEAFMAIWIQAFKIVRCMALQAFIIAVTSFMPLSITNGLRGLFVCHTIMVVMVPVK